MPNAIASNPSRSFSAPPRESGKSVTVRPGDTLSGIASRNGVSVASLVTANAGRYPSIAKHVIQPGWSLAVGGAAQSSPSRVGQQNSGWSAAQSQRAGAPIIDQSSFERSSGQTLSGASLRRIVPGLSPDKAETFAAALRNAMTQAKIKTPRQQAAFIAQTAHETGNFKFMSEQGGPRYFAQYDGRRDLGNRLPGDGERFRGRGALQLTGRANYAEFSKWSGTNYVERPELVAQPEAAFLSAAWFWETRGLNKPAEAGNFRRVTARINGGYNGLAHRTQLYKRALAELT